MNTIIQSRNIFFSGGKFKPGAQNIGSDGRIHSMVDDKAALDQEDEHHDIKDAYDDPGLIDIDVHGGYGVTFDTRDLKQGLRTYSRWAAESGEVGFVMSKTGQDANTILHTIRQYVNTHDNKTD